MYPAFDRSLALEIMKDEIRFMQGPVWRWRHVLSILHL